MELMGRDFDRVRREHLRGVKLGDFARLWLTAERRADALNAQGQVDWYLAGVQTTCRWLAHAAVPLDGHSGASRELAYAPITHTTARAIEELIEEETQAAERWIGREWPNCPGYVEGVVATLAWTWRRSGVPPIEVEHAQTG
ncbi:hypothetical protein [Kribbella sp. NPDC006257]|uniref:hypothetical protein n=1 Tax=Kribbella sp. NPDC006257 TaxID=3156738 RepID=UPI0033A1A12D